MRSLLLTLLLLGPARVADEPFVDLRFQPALERAQAEKKLLLVDFAADWCEPCHTMERDTWAAAPVRAWLAQNALAIQVDYDAETALAERFQVTSLPTVLALRDGVEVDRAVGYRGPEEFLAWTGDVLAGRAGRAALVARAHALRSTSEIAPRLAVFGELMEAGELEEALVHAQWLWTATRSDPRYAGMHTRSLVDDFRALADRSPTAREAFAALLAELQKEIDATPVPGETPWREWSALCARFDAGERILAWYEAHRDESGTLRGARDGTLPHRVVDTVFDRLVAAGRLEEAAALVPDGRARAERQVGRYRTLAAVKKEAGKDWSEGAESYARGELIADVAATFAVLLAAERRDEAGAAGAALVEVFDAPDSRLALVGQAIALAKKTDPCLDRWLTEAERRGGNTQKLRKQLAKLQRKAGQ